jgi:hypothetical protein
VQGARPLGIEAILKTSESFFWSEFSIFYWNGLLLPLMFPRHLMVSRQKSSSIVRRLMVIIRECISFRLVNRYTSL